MYYIALFTCHIGPDASFAIFIVAKLMNKKLKSTDALILVIEVSEY